MSPDLARENLLADAGYFGLNKLEAILQPLRPRRPARTPNGEPCEDCLRDYSYFCGFRPDNISQPYRICRAQAIESVEHI